MLAIGAALPSTGGPSSATGRAAGERIGTARACDRRDEPQRSHKHHPDRRRGRLPRPQELRGAGADLAGLDSPFNHRGNRVDCALATNMILGGPRHPAPGTDPGVRAAEDARRVHPGHEPGRTLGPTSGGWSSRCSTSASRATDRTTSGSATTTRPSARWSRPAPRHSRPAPRPQVRRRARGRGPPPQAGADPAAGRGTHRRRARRPQDAAARGVRRAGPAAGVRRGRRARGGDSQRAGTGWAICSIRGAGCSTTTRATAWRCSPSATTAAAEGAAAGDAGGGFESAHRRKFRVNRSLRDVEPEVNLYLHDLRAARRSGDA